MAAVVYYAALFVYNYGAEIATAIALSYASAALQPNQKGPRLSDLNVTSATFGVDKPIIYGNYRVAGNMIWASPLVQHSHSSGGKGGGNYTSYTYTGRMAVAVCDKQIIGFRKVWVNGNLIYNVGDSATNAQVIASNAAPMNPYLAKVAAPCPINFHTGSETQSVDSYIQSLYNNQSDPNYTNMYYFTPAANGGMQVTIGDGVLVVGGSNLYKPQQLAPAITPPASGYWRIDLIVIDATTGDAVVVTGTPVPLTWTPVIPGCPSGKYAIATTTMTAAQTNISSLTDVRYNVPGVSNIPFGSTTVPVFRIIVGTTTTIYVPTSFTQIPGEITWLSGFTGADAGLINSLAHTVVSVGLLQWGQLPVVLATNTAGKVITRVPGSNAYTPVAIPPVPVPAFLGTAYATFEDLDLSPYGQTMPNLEFEVIEGTQDLGAIVSDICSRAGLTSGQYDTSQLTGTAVNGYYLQNRQSARSMLQPLAQAFFFDVVESGPLIKFVPRWTNPIAANIPESDLAAHAKGDKVPDQIIIKHGQELELPQELTVKFANLNKNYLPGVQYARRTTTKASLKVDVQIPIAMTDSDALVISEKALNIAWTERNQFELFTSRQYAYLEPTDQLHLNKGSTVLEARITEKDESKPGLITFKGVADDTGLNERSLNTLMDVPIVQNGMTANPGNVGATLILDAPGIITTSGFELWIGAASNGANWAGCNVWMATDNLNFTNIGRLVGASKMGVLYADLAIGTDPDTVNMLSVDMTESAGTLSSWPASDVANFTSLCWMDGELVAFETASLAGTNVYDLTTLRRGVYGTPIGAHLEGSNFMALDSGILKYAYTPNMVGQTVYFKFQSYNLYGQGLQDLGSVTSYPHTISGSISFPDIVTNFTASQNGAVVVFQWDLAPDQNIAGYEIRYNPLGDVVWNDGTPVTQVTRGTQITTAKVPPGAFTFMIASRDNSNNYSKTAATFNLTVLNANTIISQVQQAPDWLGTCAYFVRHWTGVLVPQSQNIASADGWNTFDLFVSNPYPTCTYEATVEDGGFDSTVRVHGDITSRLGPGVTLGVANPSSLIDYRTSAGSYGGYKPWAIGQVFARYVKQEISLDTTKGIALISAYLPTVDDALRTDQASGIVVSAGGAAISFAAPFHNLPVISAQNVGATGLFATVTGETTTGFTAHVFNTSDVDVGGTINWNASGV
ncbi:MAG: hypothetical protein B7Z62_02020 [Deltaproteobacteria bacterium 37-65-8]|nr:MAG: hypothetical protein B7Z62_02020 [Deltaproteobacteria bacterium 37-65-8]